jgi:hypothetical protein
MVNLFGKLSSLSPLTIKPYFNKSLTTASDVSLSGMGTFFEIEAFSYPSLSSALTACFPFYSVK